MASIQSRRVNHYWETVKQPPEQDSLVTNAQWDVLTGEPGQVDYIETEAGGIPALWAVPHGLPEGSPVLLCFHGGGYIGGSMFTHRKLYAHLAKAIGARALVIDYTLLPDGGTYPRPVLEGAAVYRWLLNQGIPASRVAFAADSAGGGLAMLVQLRLRADGQPLPALTMLMSAWVDLESTGGSYAANVGKDVIFNRDWVVHMGSEFLAGHDPADTETMPLHADLTGLGPMYLQVGDQELLVDDSRFLAERARKAGVEVELEVYEDQQHTFQMAAGLAPEADDAISRLAAWARPRLGVTG